MLFGKEDVPPDKLTALKFPDPETFRQAARVAVEHDIPVDTPGSHTLIIRKSDKRLFNAFIGMKEQRVVDPEKVDPEELSELRRRLFHTA